MHHGSQRLMILLLTLAWLTSPATLASAVDQTPTLAGTVSMVVNSVALGPGVEWGQGILSLSDGTQYRFTVKGLEAGGVGAAQAFLHGVRSILALPCLAAREAWRCGTNTACSSTWNPSRAACS